MYSRLSIRRVRSAGIISVLMLVLAACNYPQAVHTTPPPATTEETWLPASGVAMVTAFTAPVYAAPDRSTAVVATLVKGEVVSLVAVNQRGNWYRVASLGGVHGWIEAGMLSREAAETQMAAARDSLEAPTQTRTAAAVGVTPSTSAGITAAAGTEVPTATADGVVVQAIFKINSRCRSGPGTFYETIAFFETGDTVKVEGRSQDGAWWWILRPDSPEHCWVSMLVVDVIGQVNRLPQIQAPPVPTLFLVDTPTEAPSASPEPSATAPALAAFLAPTPHRMPSPTDTPTPTLIPVDTPTGLPTSGPTGGPPSSPMPSDSLLPP